MIDAEDTIVAIASPTSPAARGVVRLSGPDVVGILQSLAVACPSGNRATRFQGQVDVGDPLGLIPVSVLLWPTTRSYTGQPSAELHTFGSLPVLTALVNATQAAGARAARPGEFTMRAFLAGRLDLTQAEAVLGVIEAEQRGSLDHALRQLAGNLSKPLEQARSTLLNLLADVEAGLDFVDEDIEFISDAALIDRLSKIRDQLDQTLGVMQNRSGGAASAIVVLRGQPNAGKSCLLNRLGGQDLAIVADVAGTTRDVVTLDADIAGRSVVLVDTAGIETLDSDVSRQSQGQARRASQNASVRLWCVDLSQDDMLTSMADLQDQARAEQRPNVTDLWVGTKADLVGSERSFPADLLSCSAVTGTGMDALSDAINQAMLKHDAEEIGSVLGTAARCSESLVNAITAIETATSLTQSVSGHEFVAAELRIAAACLGEVTGEVYTDDILDRVFGRFCIGK